jgi:two-component system, sensor histidine kinase and response regulator
MPDMDGLEATRIIRSQHKSTVPIVALTARVMKEDEEGCAAAGMNDFLTKPMNPATLKETLIKWCGK